MREFVCFYLTGAALTILFLGLCAGVAKEDAKIAAARAKNPWHRRRLAQAAKLQQGEILLASVFWPLVAGLVMASAACALGRLAARRMARDEAKEA